MNANVQCGGCGHVVDPEEPENKKKYGWTGALILGLLGLGVGATIGIATAGLGMPATIPLGLLGIYAGLKVGRKVAELQDGVTCPECGFNFSSA